MIGKDYTIVPEFRISERMEHYVSDHGGNFLIHDDAFLSLSGAVSADSSEEDFFKVYSNTDFMKMFDVIEGDYDEKELIDGKLIKKDKLALRCSAILKFLPYKGFYPAERTLELGRLFSSSYGSNVSHFTGAEGGPAINSAFRALTNPLFGPGILYNTIKSGIAVGNYIYCNTSSNRPEIEFDYYGIESLSTQTNTYYMPQWGGSVEFAVRSLGWHPIGAGSGSVASAQFGGLLPLSSSTQASGSGGYFLQQVPFEALLKPANYLASSSVPQGTIWDSGLVSASIFQYQRFSGKYPTVTASSDPNSVVPVGANDWGGAWATWNGQGSQLYEFAIDNFACEVVNFFQNGLNNFTSKREDEFEAVEKDKYYSMRLKLYRPRRTGDSKQNYKVATDPLNANDYADLEKFDMYSRPSGFGFPGAGENPATGTGINHSAPYETYTHVTPPYYYGESEVTVVYKATYDGKPTLDDIMAKSEFIYDRKTEGTKALQTSFGDADIKLFPSFNDRYNIKDSAMMITSSINVLDKISEIPPGTVANRERWLIQSKFETPVLNFSHIPLEDIQLPLSASEMNQEYINDSVRVPVWHGNTRAQGGLITRGMCHQYGKLPADDAGIFMSLDAPATVNSPTYGEIVPESLIDVVGFQPGSPKKIGTIKSQKVISEAVVAIPFTIGRDGRPKFYKLKRRQVNGALRVANGLETETEVPDVVQDLVNAQKKFVFPPKFDFVTNETVNPIAMYVFEFTKLLSQQDLADIWQNLPPGYTGEDLQTKTSTVSHSLLVDDFYDDNKRSIDSKLRWMVFKVKQRAASNYNRFVKQDLTDDLSTIPNRVETPYSYNWPYDYFSLVELVKLDAGLQYASEDE